MTKLEVRMTFLQDTDNLSLSHARKITCAEVQNVRKCGVVFTLPVDYKGIVIACKRNTLQLGKMLEKMFVCV